MEEEVVNLVINYDYEIWRFLIFALATIGLTNVLVHGKIMDVIGLRGLLKKIMRPDHYAVFECYECSGFWSGMIVGAFMYPWLFVFCGFAGSVLASTYTDFIYYLRGLTVFEIPPNELEDDYDDSSEDPIL